MRLMNAAADAAHVPHMPQPRNRPPTRRYVSTIT